MIKCSICGKEFDKPHYDRPYNDVCGSDCFAEKLWRIREDKYLKGAPFIIIDGNMYTDGGYRKNATHSFLGFSGREFKIRMNNGNEIVTNNLWHGGDIPENHRSILSDNAKFVVDVDDLESRNY